MVKLAFATDVDQCFLALNLVPKNLASNRVVWLATDADKIGIKLTDVRRLSGGNRHDPTNNPSTATCCDYVTEYVTETSCTETSCTELGHTDINCTEIGHIDINCTDINCTDINCTDIYFTYINCTDIHCTEIGGTERRNRMHHAG